MAALLNWVSSFMTALLPVDAAMCADVIPSYRQIHYNVDVQKKRKEFTANNLHFSSMMLGLVLRLKAQISGLDLGHEAQGLGALVFIGLELET